MNDLTFPLRVTDGNREMLAEVERCAIELSSKPIAVLPYSSFVLYCETGSRVEFEEQYMEHRKMLCAFCAMALLDNDNEWLYKLCDILFAICDEYSWALPAHLVRCQTVEQEETCIDLFASETAFALSEILHIFGEKLPKRVSDRIKLELDRRIIKPYLNNKPKWGKNNWSAVCISGVGASLIYLGLDKEFEEAKERIFSSLADFLDSFPDDGCCLEGSLYWFYGFSHFCYLAQLLFEYTDGEINYFADEKVKRIALFCNNMYLSDDFCIPFSDAPHRYSYNPGILHLLASKYEGIRIPPIEFAESFENSARYRFATFIRNLYYTEKLPSPSGKQNEITVYPDSGWYINRKNSYIFAAKAGHNDEPHNHNDVGSFLVFDDGKFILDDAGWAKYDDKYFKDEERYSGTKCTTSLGHSLPIINGNAQGFGKRFCGKILCADEKTFSIEYSKAYDVQSLCELERSFSFDENSLVISERAKGDIEKIIFRFTTSIRPEVSGNMVKIANYTLICNKKAEISISHYNFEPRFAGFGCEKAGEVKMYIIDFDLLGEKECEFVLEK